MAGVPYIFGNATTSIPLSNLDADFNTPVTIGNTTVGLGNTVTTLGNVTLNNVTITSGTINASVTEAYSNANAIVYANASKVGTTNANLTYDGTTFTAVNDASISGLTVGKGGGSSTQSTAVGYQALLNQTGAGDYNTALGYGAGKAITTGTTNTAIGRLSMWNSAGVTGASNTGLGVATLFNVTSGSNNLAAAETALNANTTGSFNIALGVQALYSNTTASNNTAVGYQAGYSNTTGTRQTFIGTLAGYSNTTGNDNIAMGWGAMYSNTTGTANTVVGGGASGSINSALANNTTGSYNSAFGLGALGSNTTASNNTAVGYQSLYSQSGTTGPNTAIGFQAGYNNTTGTNNTFISYQAGLANTTGLQNVYVGFQAGSTVTTGNNNIYLGANTVASSVSASQEIVIGAAGGTGKGSNTGFINPNSGGVYQGNNSATWSITSDQRLKKNIVDNTTGLDAISQIQVRNFEYRTANEVTDLPSQNAIEITGVQLGAIAQELKEILPECVKTESTGVMSVDTTNLTWYLINAVKELNAKITALENK